MNAQTLNTVQDVAEIAADWFETARRRESSEDTFVRVKDHAPAWITELVHDAHGKFLPDDWRYACIEAAIEYMRDNDEDDAGAFADDHTDIYNGALVIWLGSNLNRGGYVDEAVSEFGFDKERGIYHAIALGQYMEASEVYGSVRTSLEAQIGEEADA